MSASCPAMGIPGHSAKSTSLWPVNTSANSSSAQFSRVILALSYPAAMTLTAVAELSAGPSKRDPQINMLHVGFCLGQMH
eukprot:9386574-Pyramimonas_sp.AAC.1